MGRIKEEARWRRKEQRRRELEGYGKDRYGYYGKTIQFTRFERLGPVPYTPPACECPEVCHNDANRVWNLYGRATNLCESCEIEHGLV